MALLRLRQLLRWVRCEAAFLGVANPPAFAVSYTGQALPILFSLPDGTEVKAALRNYSRGKLPRTGARMQIRYHPENPERVEWAAAVPLLALVVAVLFAVLVLVLRRVQSSAGMV